jgi:hypothetical protein
MCYDAHAKTLHLARTPQLMQWDKLQLGPLPKTPDSSYASMLITGRNYLENALFHAFHAFLVRMVTYLMI